MMKSGATSMPSMKSFNFDFATPWTFQDRNDSTLLAKELGRRLGSEAHMALGSKAPAGQDNPAEAYVADARSWAASLLILSISLAFG